MRNMSEFYKYISKIVLKYLEEIHIQKGDRYSIQLELQEDVDSLYDSIKVTAETQRFVCEEFELENSYKTYTVVVNDVRLVIAKTDDYTKPDFLTYLRNNVDKTGTLFSGTALLFVHNSSLDSIIGGSTRLEAEGMPLNISAIDRKINEDIKNSSLTIVDKAIVKEYMHRNEDSIHESHSSINDYKDVFSILGAGGISKDKYTDFGMFFDPDISTYNMTGVDDSMYERIKNNMDLYSLVDQIHKYSDLSELEQHFDQSDAKELKENDWKEKEFERVKKFKDKYDANSKPKYKENELNRDNGDYTIWDRAEGSSAAKQRKRNILVFNPNMDDKVQLKIRFDLTIKSDKISGHYTSNIKSNNKVIEVDIECAKEMATFSRVTYFNYTFNICIVKCMPVILHDLQDKYLVDMQIKKKINRILIADVTRRFTINRGHDIKQDLILDQKLNEFYLYDDEELLVEKNLEILEEYQEVQLDLKLGEYLLPIVFRNDIIKAISISPYEVWKQKLLAQSNFAYEESIDQSSKKEVVKLSLGTAKYYPTREFRSFLKIEYKYIQSDMLCFDINNGEIIERKVTLPDDILEAYTELIGYYKKLGVLPSLTFISDEIKSKIEKFLNVYFEYIERLGTDSEASASIYRELNKLGMVREHDGEEKIHFLPMHPINLMYQLVTLDKIASDDLEKGINQYINPTNLVPYIYSDQKVLYKPISNDLIEWTTYVEYNNSKYNASNKYVPKIVSNKVQDFTSHFRYLFESEYAPLKISLVNLGDCTEILEGIFDYYGAFLKKESNRIEELKPIEIHIYDDHHIVTAFEELSALSDIQIIKERFGLKSHSKNYDELDLLSAYRNNVHFYKYTLDQIEYSHLTFYKMNDYVEIGSGDMREIESGVALDGLVSDIPSVFVSSSYQTGFGTKNLNIDNNVFINRVAMYNSFAKYVNTVSIYSNHEVIVTEISNRENDLLSKIYKKTHWVTFIDPKVDLNYFKSSENNKKLMIIHYSDQLTSSAGYDAITVTQRSSVYASVIQEFLTKETQMGTSYDYDIEEIINSFNVFNGEWLLRLVSRSLANTRDQFAREKLSLFAAVKLFEAYNLGEGQFWVPISLEELVRVSGSTGLTQKESIFSPQKMGIKGSFSDDILMVGIDLSDEQIRMMYYPIEVKVGNNDQSVIKKAKEQVATAVKYFQSELFVGDSFYSKLLRNQLVQLVLAQTKKIVMYGMWEEKEWGRLLKPDVIEPLINDNYKLVNKLSSNLNECSVITFTTNAISRLVNTIEEHGYNIDFFDYPLQDAHQYLSANLVDICNVNHWETVKKDNIQKADSTQKSGVTYIGPESQEKHGESSYKEVEDKGPAQAAEIPANSDYKLDLDQKEMNILFGTNVLNQKPVHWTPNASDKVMHTNTGIIGTMGTGKTQFTKSLITQLKQQDCYNVEAEPIGILIFDYKGDYIKDDFVKAVDATVYPLYELPFNPLSIYEGKTFKPMLPLHTANELRDTITKAYSLGAVQRNTLSDVLEDAYKSVGIVPYDRETWLKPAPTIDTVFRTYMNQELPTNDSLYAALNELSKFRIFEADATKTRPLFDLVKGVTVINLAGYSESIQNLVVAITLDTFYAQMQAKGHSTINGNYRQLTRFILVDEADNFLSKNFNSVRKILKEGREFGVGTILSTQFLKHFSTGDNKYSEYVLTWIIHKVNEISNKEVGGIFSESDKGAQERLVDSIKNLEKHYSIINLGGDNHPKHIRDKAFWELMELGN